MRWRFQYIINFLFFPNFLFQMEVGAFVNQLYEEYMIERTETTGPIWYHLYGRSMCGKTFAAIELSEKFNLPIYVTHTHNTVLDTYYLQPGTKYFIIYSIDKKKKCLDAFHRFVEKYMENIEIIIIETLESPRALFDFKTEQEERIYYRNVHVHNVEKEMIKPLLNFE